MKIPLDSIHPGLLKPLDLDPGTLGRSGQPPGQAAAATQAAAEPVAAPPCDPGETLLAQEVWSHAGPRMLPLDGTAMQQASDSAGLEKMVDAILAGLV